ncbi:MAG: glycosyltransferase [Ilumatobacteraceae bacterium]
MKVRRRQTAVRGSTFALVTSGASEGPPQALTRYLTERGATQVVVVTHPLVAEAAPEHTVEAYSAAGNRSRRTRRLPNRPPLTYVFDPFVPLVPPRVDAWIGFNCLATAQGLIWRRFGRVGLVVHWSIDYVPERFGSRALTRVYEGIDSWCCRHADGHVELSHAAAAGRSHQYGIPQAATIIPMGAWNDASPTTSIDSWHRRRVVFLGHLVERMGVEVFLDALAQLRRQGVDVHGDVVGDGPLLKELRGTRDKPASPTSSPSTGSSPTSPMSSACSPMRASRSRRTR